jgi:hypothetical protein
MSTVNGEFDKSAAPAQSAAPPQPAAHPAPMAPSASVARNPLPVVASVQPRLQQLMLRTLPIARYRLMRLGWPGLTGLALTAAAVGVAVMLLLPAHRSVTDLGAQLAQTSHAGPVIVKPEQSMGQFAKALPTRQQVPAVLGVLIAQAAAAGVALDQGRYSYSPPTANRLARYTMEFPVKGDYANVRNFIDRSLKEVPALGLDKLHVERKNVGDMAVSADVGFVIYLRGS